jgi:hypothetical protein
VAGMSGLQESVFFSALQTQPGAFRGMQGDDLLRDLQLYQIYNAGVYEEVRCLLPLPFEYYFPVAF